LGQYPEVGFVSALNKHLEARTKLAEGINPAQQKKIAKHELKTVQNNTFDGVAKAWYDSKADRRSAVWRDTHNLYLKRDLSPVLGNIPLPDITQAVLLPTRHGTRLAKCSRNFSRLSGKLTIFPVSCSIQCN
jgi:hypothetical protein